jgi:hypothetical protein
MGSASKAEWRRRFGMKSQGEMSFHARVKKRCRAALAAADVLCLSSAFFMGVIMALR